MKSKKAAPKSKMVDLNQLKTIQNFAADENLSTQYIYKLIKQQAEGHPRKLHFQLILVDGIQFIKPLKRMK